MSLTGQTFIVRIVNIGDETSGRGIVEQVATGTSVPFTSGQELLDIVFGHGGSEGDVEPRVGESTDFAD